MRTVYIRNLFKGYLKKKWIIIVGLIIFILLFGFLGFRRAYPERVDASLAAEIEEYNEQVASYDEAIAEIEENIETAQEQLAKQQEYCDNSLYMQLDPEAVPYSSIQFIVRVPSLEDDSSKETTAINNVLNTIKAYYNNGSFKADLKEKLETEYDMDTTYLLELLSFGTADKTFALGVKHPDVDETVVILNAMREVIEDYYPVVEEQFGEFTVTAMDVATRIDANSDVLSTQTTNLNTLRTYRTNLSTLETNLVTQQTNRSNYIKQYKPAGTSSSPRRTLLEYVALGVIAGIIVPLLIFAVYYTLSNRIKGKEELQAAGISVIAYYRPKKGYVPSFEKAVVNILLLKQKNQADRISLCILGESAVLEQVEKDLTDALAEKDLDVCVMQQGSEDAESLKTQSEIGNLVLLVEAGRTTYTQLEEQIQFCESLNINIWGCVVIE